MLSTKRICFDSLVITRLWVRLPEPKKRTPRMNEPSVTPVAEVLAACADARIPLDQVHEVPVGKEVICVNDCSTDGSRDILERKARVGLLGVWGLEQLPEHDDLAPVVGQLDTHGVASRYDGDAGRDRAHRAGDVVGEPDDPPLAVVRNEHPALPAEPTLAAPPTTQAQEPADPTNPLLTLSNVTLTPHSVSNWP